MNILPIKLLARYFFVIVFITFSFLIYFIFIKYFDTGMGGDDSRIYFFYPKEFLNFSINANRVSPLGTEYSQFYFYNTMKFFSLLTDFGFDYKDLYFLIFYLSMVFMLLFFMELNKTLFQRNSLNDKILALILAAIYPFNPLSSDQIVLNHWISIFSLVFVPLYFWVFCRILFKKRSFLELLAYCFFFSLFTAFLGNVSHIIVIVLVTVVFLSVLAILRFDLGVFIYNVLFLLLFFIISNLYSFYGLYRTFYVSSTAFDSFFTEQDLNFIHTLKSYESYDIYKLIFLNGLNPSSYYDWFYNFATFLFIVVMLISFFSVLRYMYITKDVKLKSFHIATSVSFLFALYLQTISLTELGQQVMVFFSKYLPLLYSLRNYVNKVPPVYIGFLLIMIYLGYYSFKKESKLLKTVYTSFLLVFLIMSIRNSVLLEDFKFNLPEGRVRMKEFSSDFFETVDFLKKQENVSRIAYLPLSNSTWTVTESGDNQTYIGLSPFTVFTGLDDINGFFYSNFLSQDYGNYERILIKDLNNPDLKKYEKHLNFLGIDLLLVDIHMLKKDLSKYMGYSNFDVNYENLFSLIDKKYHKVFTSSNEKFSIYKISTFPATIVFKDKLNSYEDRMHSLDFDSLSDFNLVFTDNSHINSRLQFKNILDIDNLDSLDSLQIGLVNPKILSINDFLHIFSDPETNILKKENIDGNFIRITIKDGQEVLLKSSTGNANCLMSLFKPQSCKDIIPFYIQTTQGHKVYNFIKDPKDEVIYLYLRNSQFHDNFFNFRAYKTNIEEISSSPFTPYSSEDLTFDYQVPEYPVKTKIDKDTFYVQLGKTDRKDPFLLILKNLYSENWEVSKNFYIVDHFRINGIFNAWVFKPIEGSSENSITIKYNEGEFGLIIKKISEYSLLTSALLVIFLLILKVILRSTKSGDRIKEL